MTGAYEDAVNIVGFDFVAEAKISFADEVVVGFPNGMTGVAAALSKHYFSHWMALQDAKQFTCGIARSSDNSNLYHSSSSSFLPSSVWFE
jgi:hypothetical protein